MYIKDVRREKQAELEGLRWGTRELRGEEGGAIVHSSSH
jgi:hypothetical protein